MTCIFNHYRNTYRIALSRFIVVVHLASSVLLTFLYSSHHLTRLLHASINLSKPEVRLKFPNLLLPILLDCIRRAHARRHNHILALLPINRRHNALLIAHLQAINYPQHLGRVAARGSRVHHAQTNLLGRVDDEDGADGERDSAFFGEAVDVLLRDHVVEPGDVAVCVGDDGELDAGVVDFVDVGDPFGVRGEVVGALGG